MSPDDFWQTCDRPVSLRLLQTGDVDEDMDINARRPGPQSHFKQKILEVLRDKFKYMVHWFEVYSENGKIEI